VAEAEAQWLLPARTRVGRRLPARSRVVTGNVLALTGALTFHFSRLPSSRSLLRGARARRWRCPPRAVPSASSERHTAGGFASVMAEPTHVSFATLNAELQHVSCSVQEAGQELMSI
jgi:hypothetical protein